MTETPPESRSQAGGSNRVILLFRSFFGGILMGLANLVPGISGGTMLLAAGIYPQFIGAIAEITTFRFRVRSVLLLLSVVIAAGLAILFLAGLVRDLVVGHRWVMYSLFIGLTLGGVPVVWRLARPATRSLWLGATVGLVGMVALALLQGAGAGTAGETDSGWLILGVAGVAGASAMILPGISGGYLLLVLGQYLPILSGIDAFKEALGARELAAAMTPATQVLLPVGIGVVAGVVGVSNLLRWLLVRYRKPTLGVLLGLLVGAIAGLWPFRQPVAPVYGETVIHGTVVTEENVDEFDLEDFPTEVFSPKAGQVAGAIGLIIVGFLGTASIARLGREERGGGGSSNP